MYEKHYLLVMFFYFDEGMKAALSPYSMHEMLGVQNESQFNELALMAFKFQFDHNTLYQSFCLQSKPNFEEPNHYTKIPFLPIQFFKSHKVVTGTLPSKLVFGSSGTTSETRSYHHVCEPEWYHSSILNSFEKSFGTTDSFSFIGLLPGYLDRPDSSLIYMMNYLMQQSKQHVNSFHTEPDQKFWDQIVYNHQHQVPTILLGVAFSLLKLKKPDSVSMEHVTVIETGGMKGTAKEITREELHKCIIGNLGVPKVCSEYGMTELLSQAYSINPGIFEPMPWMKLLIREINDPFEVVIANNKSGGINVIDLANIYSCCFIATDDVGKINRPNNIELLGRLDYSDIRGCNLLFT